MQKRIFISSLFWRLLEQWGIKLIQFLLQIILARLLMPKDYGIIAIVISFVTIANVFVDTGFSSALIQKKNADEFDYSSNFFESIFVSLVIYFILFFLAPKIATFYNNNQLIPVIRVLSLSLFFGAFSSTQYSIIARNMQFQKQFFIRIISLPFSAIIGIILAFRGFGVWALVAQYLSNQVFTSIYIFFAVSWKPKLSFFMFSRIKQLFFYGWKILVTGLIDSLYNNLNDLVVGKIAKANFLGYFNKGKSIPGLFMEAINGSILSVMFPALSSIQDDKLKMRNLLRRSIVTSCFFIFPMMIGLSVMAKSLVLLLLTEKWLPSVPFLQIYCYIYALWPLHTANLQAINAIGRSDVSLKLAILKKVLGIAILIISIPYGIIVISLGTFVSSLLSTFINAYPNKKLLDYSYFDQVKDIFPSVILSLCMGLVVYLIQFMFTNVWLVIITQMVSGTILYFSMAKLFKVESYSYLKITFQELLNKN